MEGYTESDLREAFEAGQDNANQTTSRSFEKPTQEAFKDFINQLKEK